MIISHEEAVLQARVFGGPQPEPARIVPSSAPPLFGSYNQPAGQPEAPDQPEPSEKPEPVEIPQPRPRKRTGQRYECRKFNRYIAPRSKQKKPEATPDPVRLQPKAPPPEPAQEAKPGAVQWAVLVEQLQAGRAMGRRFAELADEMIELVQGGGE